ncbi:MAG: MMPL family transporter, partial [Acidobacteriota bacterium]
MNASRAAGWLLALLVVAAAGWTATRVDWTPQIGSDFFFASDDPALREVQAVAAAFPVAEQLLFSVRVSGAPLDDADTLARLGALSDDLAAVPGIGTVWSLARGPGDPAEVVAGDSPLWSRLLITPGADDVTHLFALLDTPVDIAQPDAGASLLAAVDAIVAAHDAPSFRVRQSGVPHVVRQIQQALTRDLRVFSLAGLLVFGVLLVAIYRRPILVAGLLACCVGAGLVTIAMLDVLDVPIGLLTANLLTIVFVLTLSHLVFLTANARAGDGDGADDDDPGLRAIRRTWQPSTWAMATTLLGFLSLHLTDARPLRELGTAGALGTLVAFAIAFGLYPAVLRWQPPGARAHGAAASAAGRGPLRRALLIGFVVLVALLA